MLSVSGDLGAVGTTGAMNCPNTAPELPRSRTPNSNSEPASSLQIKSLPSLHSGHGQLHQTQCRTIDSSLLRGETQTLGTTICSAHAGHVFKVKALVSTDYKRPPAGGDAGAKQAASAK